MSYSIWMKRQVDHNGDGGEDATVRYSEGRDDVGGLLAQAVVLKASALPDPPPNEIHVTVDWVVAAVGPERQAESPWTAPADTSAPERARTKPRKIAQGDRVEVVKSKRSGVKNPPVWLEQHLGKTGVVLWTTDDGANVDLDGEAVWFAYDELERKA